MRIAKAGCNYERVPIWFTAIHIFFCNYIHEMHLNVRSSSEHVLWSFVLPHRLLNANHKAIFQAEI